MTSVVEVDATRVAEEAPAEKIETNDENSDEISLAPSKVKKIGRFTLRGETDDLPQDWWFASTAIPLLAATIGPLANVLSIAALVSKWRVTLPNNGQLPDGTDNNGVDIPDPTWAFVLNCISLGFGVFGNVFLLLNFVQRTRYIIALPVTIISWYFATAILIGITISMQVYVPPIRPGETYSQGFWHAIIAAVLYLAGSMLLMVNMLGYFLGHYPQHFDLDEHQRTLILQTMMFFFWLAGGAAVFAKVCDLSYANALYFCDVTVLTVGFGDVLASNDVGRGLVFPYSVFGIIFLGLMINSIHQFAMSMSRENVIHKHALNERERTFERSVTTEKELRDRLNIAPKIEKDPIDMAAHRGGVDTRKSLDQYGRFETRGRNIVFREQKRPDRVRSLHATGRGGSGNVIRERRHSRHASSMDRPYINTSKLAELTRRRRKELLLLREERDRFNAMRDIQSHVSHFKSYYSLSLSVLAFAILWCCGAAVFYIAEKRVQGLTYFQCLYFCYVSLLTIGYGDYSPRSNAGKPFFVVWSLMAVPTMTILVSDLGDTVVKSVNRGTFTVADWTIMPKRGVWKTVLNKLPTHRAGKHGTRSREQSAMGSTSHATPNGATSSADSDQTLASLLKEDNLSPTHMAHHLSKEIKRVSADLRLARSKKYSYEEWVDFGLLIRFTSRRQLMRADEDGRQPETVFDEVLEWDWIGEDSPMLTGLSESEWVLERLCESLERYTKAKLREAKHSRPPHQFHLTAPTFPIIPTIDTLNLDGSASFSQDVEIQEDYTHLTPSPIDDRARHKQHSSRRERSISPVLAHGKDGVEIVKLQSRSRKSVDGDRSVAS